jgi:hypothetical protein
MADVGSPYLPWRVAGAYFESCNCEAICPCRRIGDKPGGRSTYGICFGALSWLMQEGRAGDVDLAGLATALVYRYDDEPRSPWLFVLYVDERWDRAQRGALAGIFVGGLSGEGIQALPWVRKPSDLHAVRASAIAIEHGPQGREIRVGEAVSVRASRPVDTDQRVSCIVPGHHRAGTELYSDELRVRDDPFEWDVSGRCAFATDFDYASDGNGSG